jgi:deoxyribodipyrimidine photo-lyase
MSRDNTRKFRRVLVWMRRALRVADNGPLWHALREAGEVIPFVCSRDGWDEKGDTPRGRFIRGACSDLDANLRRMGSALFLLDGDPLKQIPRATAAVQAESVYVTGPEDPLLKRGDEKLARALARIGCALTIVDDSVIFGKDDILSAAGMPYTVFTPYKKAWLSRIDDAPLPCHVEIRPLSLRIPPGLLRSLPPVSAGNGPAGETMALRRLEAFIREKIGDYGNLRDIPSADGTSRLSIHLANGTISIRTVLAAAREVRSASGNAGGKGGADLFIGELIWREFFHQILGHFPSVTRVPFREQFAGLEWSRRTSLFDAWCDGRTGYPIVDAGMRQLNEEGWMHNRVRMVTASFLTKDLHIDWRWGERYFFDRLIDADVASNNGGWQWTAGTGTDAAPYFRVFNPVSQGKRFDPDGIYVRRYVPELAKVPPPFIHAPWEMSEALARGHSFRPGRDYPSPIVDHAVERGIALSFYASAQQGKRAPRSARRAGTQR